MRSNLSRRTTTMIAAVAFVAIALPTMVAVAAPKSTSDVIHACVNGRTGAVRIVSAATRCRRSESAISWNVTGPAGAPGVSAAFVTTVPGRTAIGLGAPTEVARLDLPAGSYQVMATLHAVRPTGGRGNVSCTWAPPAIGTPTTTDTFSLRGHPFVLIGVTTLTKAGVASIECESLEFGPAAIEAITLTALALDTVDVIGS